MKGNHIEMEMAEKRKVLLHLENIKMHFPLKKTKLFQKERSYVRAVDGVSIDIYEGETFGLVGESGCGKSTLGRVILQLYSQTSGSIRYSGITLNDYAPDYAFKDTAKIPSVSGTPDEIIRLYPELARIAGGLLLSNDLAGLAQAIRNNLLAVRNVNILETQLQLHEIKQDALVGSADLTASEKKRLGKLEGKIENLKTDIDKAISIRDSCDAVIVSIRDKLRNVPGFERLEEFRDVSIDLSRLTKEEMRQQRRHLQVIFQDPYSSLNSRFSVGQIISEAVIAHNMFGRGTRQLEEYTLGIMEKCGLQNYFLHRYPHQFSGGQRQRIGIARALAPRPRFVVCDEAVSALDVSIQSQIINLLMDLKESSNLTYLFISHDLSTVKFISDRVAVMYLGNIIELGDSDKIFEEPLHPYTNILLEAIPTTDDVSKKELQIIEGDIPSPINPPTGCKFHTRCSYTVDLCKSEIPDWRELRPNHWVACHFPINYNKP
jgi:peptide/nickel transport system ATP-binding protein